METRANKRKLSAKTSECIPDVATTRLGGVFAEPRGVETAGTSRTAARVQQDYIEVPIVAIKTEYEDEDAIPTQKSGWACTHQWQNPINDIVKQENDFAVEPEQGKFYEVTIKRELDIGPTTLRPETASCALLPPNEIGTCSGPLQLMLPKEEPDLSNKSGKVLKTLAQRCNQHQNRKQANQFHSSADSDEQANLGKVIKTPAQRSKEYRERRKLRQEANSRKVVKTPAQRSKEYRERRKLRQALAASDEKADARKVRKTPAQCSREYRERKKLLQVSAVGDVKAPSRRVIKTPAQRSKEYRERKKLRQVHSGDRESNSRRMRKTPAQYSREYRARKKLRLAATSTIDNEELSVCKVIKSAAQRSKEYRQRKKYTKRLQSMKFSHISGDVTTTDLTCFVANKEDLKKTKYKPSNKSDRDQEDFIEIHCLPSINVNDSEMSLSKEAMSMLAMSSDITDAMKADPDQIIANEVTFIVDHCGEETEKYSNYHQHANGHLDFFEIFRGNTFGHSCAVCDRLWWEKDLKDTSPMHESILKVILPDYVTGTNIKVCSTCKVALDRQKIPTLSTYNGFSYPAIPSHLPALDIISQQLISPRIPFTQIRRLRHVKGQDGIYGQIVNVPLSTNTMVHRLPRNIDDDHCLYVHIEKKLIHNTSYVLRLINKENIKKWVTYLVQTPLYMHYNITINEEFFNSDRVGPDINVDDISEHIPIGDNITAQQQTLLWNEDRFLHMASKGRNDSISVLFDGHAEELSFPNIFCGQFRKYREEISVTSFMQAASELRRTDRRGADPQHLLYVATKIMRHRVRASVTVALKHIGNSTNIPKKQIQSNISNYINNCIESNLAFLRCIPNSTWYWAECEEDLLAMFRQRGTPTAFMSLSANETGWTDLLKLLYRLKNNGKEISDESLSEMNYIHKAELVNQDAVTCAIYLNRLVTCLLHILQYKKRSPLGRYRVVDYFKKIEFQHGGCPHARILLWLDRTPKNLFHGNTEFIQMIDELVSVSASEASGYIELQTHEHSFACYKRTDRPHRQDCRCGAPFMPSRNTVALLPMTNDDGEHSEEQFKKLRHHYKLIKANLENIDYTNFEQFYTHNCIESDEHYYNILRAGINRPNRIHKQDRQGSRRLSTEARRDVRRKPRPRRRRDDEGSGRGCGAFRRDVGSGGCVVFVARTHGQVDDSDGVHPTMRPVERQRIRKTMRELNATDGDCADVWKENWFDKYERRPGALRDVTLAQFVSRYYENKKGEYVKRSVPRVIRYRNYDAAADADDHKREMVLLHYAFRSEENDVLAEKKYRQIYEDNEDLISQRRKELESNSDIEGTVEMYRRSRGGHGSEDDELRNEAYAVYEAGPCGRLSSDTV
ncbi:hypothetical protein EVAR_53507_1 [Eumeta japonica]|uniref:ATP-dependent DNA helicase n=1 Tax=Eumeta variegata TaxID=151549 RepID=A0A4C1Y676_EUMVA|nr:hypothetical protein EVAR_53507_1 [Eumeta japonica]